MAAPSPPPNRSIDAGSGTGVTCKVKLPAGLELDEKPTIDTCMSPTVNADAPLYDVAFTAKSDELYD